MKKSTIVIKLDAPCHEGVKSRHFAIKYLQKIPLFAIMAL